MLAPARTAEKIPMKNSNLISRILSSIFFKRANVGAVRYARNTRSLMELIREALEKGVDYREQTFQPFVIS
jgi:hypothetical protein